MQKLLTKIRILFVFGVLLCALCCSLPLLVAAGLGGASLLALGAHGESLGLVLLAMGVLALVTTAVARRARTQREHLRAEQAQGVPPADTCAVGCGCGSGPKSI